MELRKLVKPDRLIRVKKCIDALAEVRGMEWPATCALFISWVEDARVPLFIFPPQSSFAEELTFTRVAEMMHGSSRQEGPVGDWLAISIDDLPAVLGFALPPGCKTEWATSIESLQSAPKLKLVRDDAPGPTAATVKSGETKERDSLLCILAALADQAGIDPSARGAAGQIAVWTEQNGAPVGRDTVKKYLDMISDSTERRSR